MGVRIVHDGEYRVFGVFGAKRACSPITKNEATRAAASRRWMVQKFEEEKVEAKVEAEFSVSDMNGIRIP